MSDARTIDRESRRRIREELLTNLLVEAGAGSGKTQMLAERMAAGVAAGVYQVEHMAAVTFTRKAASELRGRLHLALEGELLAHFDTHGRADRRRRGRAREGDEQRRRDSQKASNVHYVLHVFPSPKSIFPNASGSGTRCRRADCR